MWKALGKRSQILLRRLFFSARSRLRLRLPQEDCQKRKSRLSLVQHVAVLRISSPARRLYASEFGWRNAAGTCAASWQKMGTSESLREERRRQLSVALVQGSRRCD